jgi:hypothetical protein
MAIIPDTGTLYDAQAAAEMPPRLVKMMDLAGADYAMGQLHCLYSELASFAAGGQAGDYIDYFKLPPGTLIVGGWFYWEDGLGGADNDAADLGIVYEDGDGTDDVDALCDGLDIYDGQTSPLAVQEALPTGSWMPVGTDVEVFPYKVATVRLTSVSAALVTAKDTKLVLYVILPA